MEKIVVLSLFDGMSCGQQALERAEIPVEKYFASEIDKYAITVTQANYRNTVQLGSVVDINPSTLPKIDFLCGGSPCQSFSFAGKRKGMSTKDEQEILTLEHYMQLKAEGYEFEGQSYLFWEYMRILTALRKINPDIKFLLENVMMGSKWEKILTKAIGVNPVCINSSLVSAQNRERLYWTNIGLEPNGFFGDSEPTIQQPRDKKIFLKHIIEAGPVSDKYFLSEKMVTFLKRHAKKKQSEDCGFKFTIKTGEDKANTVNQRTHKMGLDDNYIVHNVLPRSSKTGKGGTGPLSRKDRKTYCLDATNAIAVEFPEHGIRRLTPKECERLQTVPDDYTNHVSDTQRYRMLGNGWNIDTIVHLLSYYKQ